MGLLKTFALFFDSCIGIITTICSRNGINMCNYCKNSIIYSILCVIISYFCIKHSENRHLSENVVVMNVTKKPYFQTFTELLHILIPILHIFNVMVTTTKAFYRSSTNSTIFRQMYTIGIFFR